MINIESQSISPKGSAEKIVSPRVSRCSSKPKSTHRRNKGVKRRSKRSCVRGHGGSWTHHTGISSHAHWPFKGRRNRYTSLKFRASASATTSTSAAVPSLSGSAATPTPTAYASSVLLTLLQVYSIVNSWSILAFRQTQKTFLGAFTGLL